MRKSYKVLIRGETGVAKLESEINDLAVEGWQLVGPVQVAQSTAYEEIDLTYVATLEKTDATP